MTDRRTAADFAVCMKELVDEHYPNAHLIHVVLDNLSTRKAAALYETFDPAEARRILRRLEFHYTREARIVAQHGENRDRRNGLSVLDRRIPTKTMLTAEVATWERARNRDKARVRWHFTVDRAREKLGRSYPTCAQPTSARKAA